MVGSTTSLDNGNIGTRILIMKYLPKGESEYNLSEIVLDLNGTLAVNGKFVKGVKQRIEKLKELGFTMYLLTGDQRGTAAEQAKSLGIQVIITPTGKEKEAFTKTLKKKSLVAIGNARIDIGTFKHASLRIATVQSEGIHAQILKHVDIVVPSINSALDLLINPDIFCATMRR